MQLEGDPLHPCSQGAATVTLYGAIIAAPPRIGSVCHLRAGVDLRRGLSVACAWRNSRSNSKPSSFR